MAGMDRRKFLKVGGTTIGVAIFSLGLQNAVVSGESVKPEAIPGSGNLTPEELSKIDVDIFTSRCARCGICAEVCPFKAVRFTGLAYPSLTSSTRGKCVGFFQCGICIANCPVEALSVYDDVPFKEGLVKRKDWWNGPNTPADRVQSGLSEQKNTTQY